MRPAAVGCGILVAIGCLFAWASEAPGASKRTLPSRPLAASAATRPGAGVPSTRINGVECVSVARASAQLGVKVTARDSGRTVLVTGPGTRAELEADTRDITVNGLRVFLGNPVYFSRGELFVSRIDFERCLAPMLRPGHGVPLPTPPKVIAIDAGHGGRDHGKINDQLKINEKTYTLDVAKRLQKLLEGDGYRVVLTRADDRFIELPERPAIANRASADLFVSIHFNALGNDRKTSGVEVYTFAPQAQRSTEAWMPGLKDDSEPTASPGNDFDYWNALLAQAFHRTFINDLKASDRGKKLMHLGVLRSLRCPGALVECGFLSSDLEARKIATPAYRQQIAEALRDGVRDYTEMIATLRQKAGGTSAPDRTSRPS